MRFSRVIVLLVLSLCCWMACSDEDRSLQALPPDSWREAFSGSIVGSSKCKSDARLAELLTATDSIPADQDCIFYSYDGSSTLLVTHVNAGLNCCPVIAASFQLTDTTISIVELDSTINGGCRCLCLLDIQYRLEGVSAGDYRIVVSGPFAATDISFSAELSAADSGSCCVARETYPWEQP